MLAGDAIAAQLRTAINAVSIRARHCWRAMLPCLSVLTLTNHVSIRARHCWRAMQSQHSARCLSRRCFNPRPPLLAGDAEFSRFIGAIYVVSIRARHCWRAMPVLICSSGPCVCFNPRPPLLAGDALHWLERDSAKVVSIRARHCWRAMPSTLVALALDRHVSFRARHCWRAMRAKNSLDSSTTSFQSAPAIAGGRCR